MNYFYYFSLNMTLKKYYDNFSEFYHNNIEKFKCGKGISNFFTCNLLLQSTEIKRAVYAHRYVREICTTILLM